MTPKIIYITSLGHSGSTLLDILTSTHSGVVSVGEAKNFNPENGPDARCSCEARTVWECPFWQAVDAELQKSISLPLKALDLRNKSNARFLDHNRAFYAAVSAVSGKSVIVDSSKSNSRLDRLLGSGEFDILPIHLLRRPHGAIYSQVKKGRSWLRFCRAYTRRTWRTRWLLRGHRHVVVRYEELATDPTGVISMVMEQAGLAFEPQQLDWAERERHNCGGNRMRRSKSSTIRLDSSWKEGLTAWQKATISLLTFTVGLSPGLRGARSGPR